MQTTAFAGWRFFGGRRVPTSSADFTGGIQRRVHASFGTFRRCYEDGLQRDPQLGGRVSVWFVVGPDGRVACATRAIEPPSPAPMSAPDVVACIVDGFQKLQFPHPQPEGESLTVVYPILFAPGDPRDGGVDAGNPTVDSGP